ncbi:MAG: hypothetical protein RR835_02310 [Peptostreptococcaceae bacterium]
MNKEKFNSLTILEQIDFLNSQIKNNKSITSVCKELGIGRSTIRDRFKKLHYAYSKDLNKYIKVDPVNNDGCNTSDIINEDENLNNKPIVTILEKTDIEIQNNLLDLVENYNVLKEIIELHKCNTSVIKQQIIINLEDTETETATLRINKTTLNKFNEFCKNNKQFKKVDLLSQALKNFIELHS